MQHCSRMQIKLVVAVVAVDYNHILIEVYTMYILRTRIVILTLSRPNMTKGKFDKTPKFHFVKFFKTNNTTWKYFQRDFIWMVAPHDFVHRRKSKNHLTNSIIHSGSERVSRVCFPNQSIWLKLLPKRILKNRQTTTDRDFANTAFVFLCVPLKNLWGKSRNDVMKCDVTIWCYHDTYEIWLTQCSVFGEVWLKKIIV